MSAVLGIDVGFSERKNTTCLTLLTWGHGLCEHRSVKTGSSDERRRESLRSLLPMGVCIEAVAIDGPLCRDLEQVKHYRSADALLSRGRFQRRGKPGQTSSPTGQELHRHATQLARLVLELVESGWISVKDSAHWQPVFSRAIVEAFPSMFLAALIPEDRLPEIHRDASDRYWETAVHGGYLDELLNALIPGEIRAFPPQKVSDHEKRAGIVCALTALSVARRRFVGVGDPEGGDIILPPADAWGRSPEGVSWFERTLRENLPKVRGDARRNHPTHAFARVRTHDGAWFS